MSDQEEDKPFWLNYVWTQPTQNVSQSDSGLPSDCEPKAEDDKRAENERIWKLLREACRG